jgi:DNA-binding NarL/FixJ family response regulator
VIKAAHEGRVVVDSAVIKALPPRGSRENTAYQRLSVREIDVADRMAEGFKNKAMAASLNIKEKPVESDSQTICAKIGNPSTSGTRQSRSTGRVVHHG